MRRSPDKVYGKKKAAVKRSAKKNDPEISTLVKKGKKKRFFDHIAAPMLATLVDKPFDAEGWRYEIKWDGYRTVAFMHNGNVWLKSRNDKSFSEKFYPVRDALAARKLNAVIDGEIVVADDNGHANFGALQHWKSEADGTLLYYVFDILWCNGHDVTQLPLTERQQVLEGLLEEDDLIKISRAFKTSGIAFLKAARKMGLEGIMAKREDSTYQTGIRTKDWLKIKAGKRQEVVIGGFTRNVGTGKPFSSLLVGVFDKGRLVYTGKIGTGFSIRTQKEIMKQCKPLITGKPPFAEEPDINKPGRFRPYPPKATATWLKPELICEVSYTELTTDGVMRHPSFEGMREDKAPRAVKLEKEMQAKDFTGSR